MDTFNGTFPPSLIDPSTGGINTDLCTLSTCPMSLANFSYIPNLAGNALYLAIFSAALLPQLYLGIKGKTIGFMFSMVIGIALEILGYAARVQMHYNPFRSSPFLEYIVSLTIAPAFLSAGIYLCLGRLVVVFGEDASRIAPRTYTLLFASCDFLSLLLQAVGGAIADTASSHSTTQIGVNVMIAGLSTQVVSLFLFIVLGGEYAWRVHKRPSQRNPHFEQLRASKLFKAFIWGLCVATLAIFVRTCFRVAELSGGFNGRLFNDQVVFMVLEGPMVIIAVVLLTALHPTISFQGMWAASDWPLRRGKNHAGRASRGIDVETIAVEPKRQENRELA